MKAVKNSINDQIWNKGVCFRPNEKVLPIKIITNTKRYKEKIVCLLILLLNMLCSFCGFIFHYSKPYNEIIHSIGTQINDQVNGK